MIDVDRLDYSKGLTQRMEAVDLFFSNWPDLRGKVTYLQIAPKSRSVEASWTPIRCVNRAYSRTALAGLYRGARVGLVNSLVTTAAGSRPETNVLEQRSCATTPEPSTAVR